MLTSFQSIPVAKLVRLTCAFALFAGLHTACKDTSETSDDDDDVGPPTGGDDDDDNDDKPSTGTDTTPSASSGDDDDDDDDGSDPTTSDSPGGDDDDDVKPSDKFDLGEMPDIGQLDPGRCGIDFVFVVDNSLSMEDEQANLIASFPGFIAGIRETLDTDDFQVLAIDSDGEGQYQPICSGGTCTCIGKNDLEKNACCQQACANASNTKCNNQECSAIPQVDECETKLGAGKISSGAGQDCMFSGDLRYLLGTDPNLEDAFACAAKVGIEGDFDERMMAAMNAAVSQPLVMDGGCNEKFLRNDTVLAVVFITDEEEKVGEGSQGVPQQWYDDLIAAKGGKTEQVVMIGFFGDTGQPGALCEPMDENANTGAEVSPRLREFVGLFGDSGLASSVCAPDYGPAFTEAIGKIDAACKMINPK